MNRIKIIVKDLISSSMAISPEGGEKLYEEIIDNLKAGNVVDLDFSGIDIILSVFLNKSVGKIYGTEYKGFFNDGKITISNMSKQDLQTLELVKERAIKFFKDKQ